MALNKIAKTLIFYDFALFFGCGLIAPILAIFITDSITGGDVRVAGIADGIFLITRSFIVWPLGKYLDKKQGKKVNYYFLVIGPLIASVAALSFLLAYLPWHVYLIEFFYAVGFGLAMPGWYGIFSPNVDQDKHSQSWSLDSSAVGLGAGVAGIMGGIVAKDYGFAPLFLTMSGLGIFSVFLCLLIKNEIIPKKNAQRNKNLKNLFFPRDES